MTLKRRYIVGLGLLGIAVVAIVPMPSSRPAPPPSAMKPVAQPMEAPVVTPLPKPARVAPSRAPTLGRAPAPARPLAASAPNDEVSAPSTARGERLQKIWETQAADEAWTNATSESLSDMITSAGLAGDVLKHVDCRATLCRIELALDGPQSAMKLGPVVAASPQSFEITRMPVHANEQPSSVEAESELHYVVYAARPGEQIALPDEAEQGI